jgi:hypothetical protein
MTYNEYITEIHAELEKRGMDLLVNAYLPPVEATAQLIASLTKIGWRHGVPAPALAELIVESFKTAANKVVPKQ